MFQFTSLAPGRLGIQRLVSGYYPTWVAPFGNLRIVASLRLPEAFRSLPRPSSPPDAKAFTMCP